MPLVVTLKEGHDLYVGDHHIVIRKVERPTNFTVSINSQHPVSVTGEAWVDLAEGVKVKAGLSKKVRGSTVRLLIEAKSYKVLRSESYRENKKCTTCRGSGIIQQPLYLTNGTTFEKIKCPDCH